MAIRDSITTQSELFNALIRALSGIGYSGDLLKTNYSFPDFFAPGANVVTAPAAAFGQTPVGYDSACFVVVVSNGKTGLDLIRMYRALGAPRAFEIRPDRVVHWRVSLDPTPADEQEAIRPENLATHFRQKRSEWEPARMLRAKDVAAPGPRQLDFIDLGLIPALEENVRANLGPLLKGVLYEASQLFRARHRTDPPHDELVRLVFRSLSGKVMCDRGVSGFGAVAEAPKAAEFLQKVADYYRDDQAILDDLAVQQAVVDKFWQSFSFQNLSTEVLAFVWEDTLVTDSMRAKYGIHATPAAVARYMTHRLPLWDFRPSERRVVEPCCGSGVFLVAALRQLRNLLPPDLDARRRHQYFQRMLTGYDLETFGLEVARSCLMLADFPNPNGWKLYPDDVFQPDDSAGLIAALKKARVVLCNPPFEDFTPADRRQYGNPAVQKPVELLRIVLDNLHPEGVLGFVLPAAFLDGRSYRRVRRRVAERFQRLEVVKLPDKVFERAEFPCALLLATHPADRRHNVTVAYATVADEGTFLRSGDVGYVARRSMTIAEVQKGITAPKLAELWEFLTHHARLKDAVKQLSRGVEWHEFTANRERFISQKPKRGHVPGFHTATELNCFQPPPIVYLWNRPEARRGGSWGLPWHESKVIVNAVRKARQPWRLAACPVELNAVASQNFTVAWPADPWTPNSLAAVLNGPVAAAYVATHENWKHNKKSTLAAIPLPDLSVDQIRRVDELVWDYRKAASLSDEFGEQAGMFGGFVFRPVLQQLLGEIDALVLRGYRLPPELQRALLAYFGQHPRPVPFRTDSTDIEKAMANPAGANRPETDELRGNWELFRRAMEEDRFPQRSLFRWRE